MSGFYGMQKWELEARQRHIESFGCDNCHKCLDGNPEPRMIVCIDCGNKRCPKATDCSLECTGSNEIGQNGSMGFGGMPDSVYQKRVQPVKDSLAQNSGWW